MAAQRLWLRRTPALHLAVSALTSTKMSLLRLPAEARLRMLVAVSLRPTDFAFVLQLPQCFAG
jgi:hypothetical protein